MESKAALREHWKRSYPRDVSVRQSLSEKIAARLLASEVFQGARKVALYHPLPWEPDLTALWRARPSAVVFPKATRKTRSLTFYSVTSLSHLVSGFAGLKEPPVDPANAVTQWNKDDLILVPGYAFDRWGGRVGSGMGFYDRFLAGLPVKKWGVCFTAQIVKDRLAQEATDVRMERLCSEAGIECCFPK